MRMMKILLKKKRKNKLRQEDKEERSSVYTVSISKGFHTKNSHRDKRVNDQGLSGLPGDI